MSQLDEDDDPTSRDARPKYAVEIAEQRPLLDGSTARVVIPRRKVIVEPLVMLYAAFEYPTILLSQTFIYNKIFSDRAAEEGLNITFPDQSQTSQCYVNTSDHVMYKFQEEVQSASSYFTLIMAIAGSVFALFVTILVGPYSDRAGRRYAIIPPLAGNILATLTYVIVIYVDLDLWYLLIGAILQGFGGRFTMFLMGCFAYIADITTPEQRMFRITIVDMMMVFAIIFGPIGVATALASLGHLYAFLIVMIGQILSLLYAIFFIPETIRRDPDAKFFALQPVKRTISLFTEDNGKGRRWQLCLLMLSSSFTFLPNEVSLSTLFELNTPLCWDVTMMGYFSATYFGVASVGAIIAARLLKCCISDQPIALIAGLAAVLKVTYMAFVQDTLMMFFTPLFGIFSMLYSPTIRTLMSKLVEDYEQGTVFGALACAQVACSLVGGAIFNPIYANTLHIMTGFVFLSMAIFYFIGCLIYIWYLLRLRKVRHPKRPEDPPRTQYGSMDAQTPT